MPAIKHTHTYGKMKNRPGYWKCNHPECTHYVHRDFVMGKASLCNQCGGIIPVLNHHHLALVKPLCINCSNTKEAKEFRERKERVQNVLGQLGIVDS